MLQINNKNGFLLATHQLPMHIHFITHHARDKELRLGFPMHIAFIKHPVIVKP